jgi:hypothetical protein
VRINSDLHSLRSDQPDFAVNAAEPLTEPQWPDSSAVAQA